MSGAAATAATVRRRAAWLIALCLTAAAPADFRPTRVRAERLVGEGRRRFEALDYAGAADAVEEALRNDTGVPGADLLLGLAYFRWGRTAESLRPLERAARENVRSAPLGRVPDDVVFARRYLDRARSLLRGDAAPEAAFRRAGRWTERFAAPTALAATGDGRVAVADSQTGRVSFLDSRGGVGGILRGFSSPSAVAIGADSTVWVAEAAADRVTGVLPGGARRSIPAADAPSPARLSGPSGIAVLPGGDLLVADGGSGRILRFAPEGGFRGVVATGLRRPMSILRLADGRLLVAEVSGPSVARLTSSGEVEARLAHPEMKTPVAAVVAGGRLYVADRGGRIFHGPAEGPLEGPAADAAGRPLVFDVPNDLVVDAAGLLWVAEAGGAVSAVRTPSTADRGFFVEILRLEPRSWPYVEAWTAVRDGLGRPVDGIATGNVRVLERRRSSTNVVDRYDARPMGAAAPGRVVAVAVPLSGGAAAAGAEIDRTLDLLLIGVGEAEWTALTYAETATVVRRGGVDSSPAGRALLRDDAGADAIGRAGGAGSAPSSGPRPAEAVEAAVRRLSRDPRTRSLVLFVPERFDPSGLETAMRYAAEQLVAVHVVDLARRDSPDRRPLGRLADGTGGRRFFAYGPGGVRRLPGAVAERTNPLLSISYESPLAIYRVGGVDVSVVVEVTHPLGTGYDRTSYRQP